MSTISLHHHDYSDALCKRFAYLTSTYMEAPEQARKAEAHVPLENLFRLLQMFRYESFEDSERPGILASRAFAPRDLHITERPWHHRIEAALHTALVDVFGTDTPKDAAIEEIQASLRWLATNSEPPPPEVRDRSRAFMGKLISALE